MENFLYIDQLYLTLLDWIDIINKTKFILRISSLKQLSLKYQIHFFNLKNQF